MARTLAVEGEAGLRRADFDQTVAAAMPAQRLDRVADRPRAVGIGRLKRILREGRENVGKEQFLVLLLMVDAELDEVECGWRQRRQSRLERRVDRGAIGADLV